MAGLIQGQESLQRFTNVGESFLLNEDAALKALLSGMTVADEKSPSRPVGVWFGMPDMEIRAQAYPYLVIDLVDVREAPERAVSGVADYNTDSSGNLLPANTYRAGEWPIPYDIDYQITAYSRHPRHDRSIIAQMLTSKTPGRYGDLDVTADSTKRHLFLLNFHTAPTVEDGRKLFVSIFDIRVTSESSMVPSFSTALIPSTTNLTVGEVDPNITYL